MGCSRAKLQSYVGSNMQNPEEMWSRVQSTVDYFIVFGCLAHVHVPDQRTKNQDDRALYAS